MRVVYILGPDHSGSTLLSLILNSLPDTIAAGELWAFTQWIQQNKQCSCTHVVSKCDFWIETFKRYTHLLPTKNQTGKIHNPFIKSLKKHQKIQAYFNKPINSLITPEEINSYGLYEFALLKAIEEISGKSIIVDESKYIERLVKLYFSQIIDLKIIYLVRDGRAALESSRRAYIRGTRKNKARAFIEIIKWVARIQTQLNFLLSIDQSKIFFLTYKELTQNTFLIIKNICSFLNIEYNHNVLNIQSKDYFFKQNHHLIGGNRIKYSQYNTIIQYKNNWIEDISKLDNILFKLLGAERLNNFLNTKEV